MHFGILGNVGSWYVKDFTRAAELRGHTAVRLDFRDLAGRVNSATTVIDSGETDLTRFDAVIVRTMPPGSLEQVVFRMDALARLEAAGVPVVNSAKSIECAVDKFLTTSRLQAAGLPVPETIACETSVAAMSAFAALGGDVVVKPIFGAEGRGIMRISDQDLAFRSFRTLERLSSVLYLQEFIPHRGYDTRVLVLDGEVLGAMRRHSTTDFRTNVARQAVTEPHSPTERECELAQRSAAAVGAKFAGVDLLEDQNGGEFVIEVNAVPGWRAFAKTTEIDVAWRFAQWLERFSRSADTPRL